ncbi:MAG: hypothetical protein ACTSX9_00680 [Candidatus Njordarchaeales archaeon]
MGGTLIFIETEKDHYSKFFLIKGNKKEINKLLKAVKAIFKEPSTEKFLTQINNLFEELKNKCIKDVEKFPFISANPIGEAKAIVLNYNRLPENLYAITISKRVWQNPKDPSEKQISIETQVIDHRGILTSFQRVLIMKGNVLFDAKF